MKQSLQIFTRIFTSLAIIGAIVSSLSLPASAANGQIEMTVSPAKLTPEIKKGQTHKDKFEVYNSGEADFKIKVYASPYQATNDGYKLESTSDRSLLHNWIKFEQSEYEIKAKSSATVEFSIEAPKNIPDGGQYGLIFAETINDTEMKSSGVTAASRIGVLIYASTDGVNQYAGDFNSINIPFLNINSKANFSVKSQNTGNTHYDVNATLTISDLFGNAKETIVKNGFTVLPDVNKEIEFTWEKAPLIALMNVNLKASAPDINKSIDETRLVLFVSPVFLIILTIIIIIIGTAYVANKKLSYRYKK